MNKSLNTYIVRTMIALTLVAFAVMYFGLMTYYFFLYDWLFPNTPYDEKWQPSDFVVFGLIIFVGVVSASLTGWRLAQSIVRPLKSVAAAARQITSGDFSSRAQNVGSHFGEAHALINDFNTMAERLEKTEAELKYSNSAIAHELRTPLTILRGRLQGLMDGAYAPSPELYARLIVHVDDLSAIVEELRTLAMANAGKMALVLEKIDVSEEVSAALVSIEQNLAQANIKVERHLEKTPAMADKTRIRQAMLAMLDNCCRYAAGSTVFLNTGSTASYVYMRCSDTGPGLPAEMRDRAFERFWRADESRTRARGGSGLGLSIVRGIARAHNGEALIVDKQGPGFAVELRLPLQERIKPDLEARQPHVIHRA